MKVKPDKQSRRRQSRYAYALGIGLAASLAALIVVGVARGLDGGTGDPHHGSKVAAAHCASCHGANGNSTNPQYPKLAGQDAAYLYRQLWAFKDRQRPSAVMQAIVALLSDADLADVSAYYEAQTIRPDPVPNRRLANAGQQLFYAGRPSCAMCHEAGGMPMMGMMSGGRTGTPPRLAGQHAPYTLQQLDAFASGQRQGGIMNQIAAQLDRAQRRALAAYIAGKH